METKNEQQVEVLTQEQINKFPEEIKKQINVLTSGAKPGEVIKFNPLVSELLALQERGSNLKMKPKGEDGKFNKENVQEFIDLKKDIRTYRSSVKKTADALKAPRLLENKAINAIQKSFTSDATAVYESAEKEFDEYVKAEEEKARLAKEKKDKALNDKIAAQQKEIDEQKRKSESSQVFNKIKYTLIAENITTATTDAILKSNESTLAQMQAGFVRETFESLTENLDLEYLSDDLISDLKQSFAKAKSQAISLIAEKLTALEKERKSMVEREASEKLKQGTSAIDFVIPPAVPPAPVPSPPNLNTGDKMYLFDEIKNYHLYLEEKQMISKFPNLDTIITNYLNNK